MTFMTRARDASTSMIYIIFSSSNTKSLSNLPLQVSFMIDSIHMTPTLIPSINAMHTKLGPVITSNPNSPWL